MTARIFYIAALILFTLNTGAIAQDTLSIDYDAFLSKALNNSGQIDYERQNIDLAENRVAQAKAQRILPNVRFESQHGLVPGVKSDNPNLPEDEYYLDPNLRNDWEDWAIYTKFQLSAAQPVFTWGAINKAVEAAKLGAEAAEHSFDAKKADLEIRLFELYFSYVLALEIERLLNEAQDKVNQVERQINKMQEEGDASLDDSEVFKFEIFKSEFEIQKAEVFENMAFVRETWNYVLRNDEDIIFEPEVRFLDPVASEIESVDFYQQAAFNNRPELKALEAGEEATETYISSLKKQTLPGLYLGGYVNFANTPNRPRQSNPFIQNNTNLFSGGFGFTIRQNLNFFSIKASLERSQIELRKVAYAQDAAKDGILLEVNNNYRAASLADVKVKQTDKALITSKRWLRQEQLDHDFGMGDAKDLIDAMKKELELKLQLKQRIFEYNSSLAKLNKSAGIPLTTMITN
ncbi:MAG: TolC family protein [Gracilimonas sp.]|uniref:TolC family protein n=1 Tax=Gracilimonas sp. TaxID=1974203 RepID=UPI0019AC1BBB|nr:TolC family protein [Gracilimonas sp.]MBD3616011.1 TolC family protein [Gracilimonas sp.]